MNSASRFHRAAVRVAIASAIVAFHPAPSAAAASPAPAHIVYTSPAAGAQYVRPGEGLIVRLNHALDVAQASTPLRFTVTGALSGAHAGVTLVAPDSRTVLFRPATRFAWGERVDVGIESAAPLAPDEAGVRAALSFTIARERAPAAPRRAASSTDPLDWLRGGRALLPLRAATADTLPDGYPTMTVHLYGTPAPGRLFMSSFPLGPQGTPFLIIAGNAGGPVYSRAMPLFCTDFKVQPDGRLTYFDTNAEKFYAMDSSYAVIDSFQCGNDFYTDLHELRLLPNGHAVLMGIDQEIVDMSAVVAGGNPAAAVSGLVIQELDQAKNVVFQWRSWDHFQITDATHEDLTAATIDYVHGNALELDNDGNLLLSSRHMDEITKIDRTTGDIVWRWGGTNNQFTLLGDTVWFSHQHAIRRIANGHVTLFDNGNFHDPPYSRAVEYALDEVNHTAEMVWQYRDSPDTYGNAMGYVQRLDNGSTLISWGTGKPDLIEVTADGSRVMDLSLGPNVASYRMLRQSWVEPAVASVNAPAAAAVSLSPNRPNPFRGETELMLGAPGAEVPSLQVLDVQGRDVSGVAHLVAEGPGEYRVRIDLKGSAAGVYFVRVATRAGRQTRRIIHLE